METDKIQLLATRIVDEAFIKLAEKENVFIDNHSFVDIELIQSDQLSKELDFLSAQQINAVCTSINAVSAIIQSIKAPSLNWNFFSIEGGTSNAIIKYFGKECLLETAFDAAELAQKIVNKGTIKELVFFCGNLRRDDLPGILLGNHIAVHELIVYKTIIHPIEVEDKYDGIIFFSPSAVESFFSKNIASGHTVFFAIGKTTAATITKYIGQRNMIIVAGNPSKKDLLTEAINFFKSSHN